MADTANRRLAVAVGPFDSGPLQGAYPWAEGVGLGNDGLAQVTTVGDSVSRAVAGEDRAVAREATAFEDLLRSCQPELLRYLRSRLHNEADAADIAQEACARLLQYRDDPQIGDLRLMLFRIANNLLTDFWRRNHRHCADQHVPLDDAGPLQAHERPQVERIADHQALLALKRAIQHLPQKCRLVFMLSRFDGLSHGQIAARLGISVKMVEKHITRALLDCHAAVGDRDA